MMTNVRQDSIRVHKSPPIPRSSSLRVACWESEQSPDGEIVSRTGASGMGTGIVAVGMPGVGESVGIRFAKVGGGPTKGWSGPIPASVVTFQLSPSSSPSG